MKVRRRVSRGIPPLILNLNIKWRLVSNFTLRPFYSRKEPLPPPPLGIEPGWAPQLIWTFGDQKISDLDSNSGLSSP
jgi:hypothetical protein